MSSLYMYVHILKLFYALYRIAIYLSKFFVANLFQSRVTKETNKYAVSHNVSDKILFYAETVLKLFRRKKEGREAHTRSEKAKKLRGLK